MKLKGVKRIYSLQGAYPREDKIKIKKKKKKIACSPAQPAGVEKLVVLAQLARIGIIGTTASFTFA